MAEMKDARVEGGRVDLGGVLAYDVLGVGMGVVDWGVERGMEMVEEKGDVRRERTRNSQKDCVSLTTPCGVGWFGWYTLISVGRSCRGRCAGTASAARGFCSLPTPPGPVL